MPFRVLLSALTLFGGHLVNRRLDRVIVVFAALALLGITSYMVVPTLFLHIAGADVLGWSVRVPGMLIIATALISAALTWKDAKTPVATPLSLSLRVAGTIISLFGFMVLATTALTLTTITVEGPRRSFHQPIFTSAHFGGVTADELKRPPAGPHPLRGRILMDGKAAEDVQVEVMLNGAYESKKLLTDGSGEFELRLPAGAWYINQIAITGWDDAPEERELLLFSEFEPVRKTGYYSRYQTHNDRGLEINLPAAANSQMLTFELRDAINVQWPARTSTMDSSSAPVADIATDVISWKAVPSAAEYEVQLNSITREDGSTWSRSLLLRQQRETTLRLADLPQEPRESEEPSEYSVTVFAFDAAGKLITQSRDSAHPNAFKLAGEMRLGRESYPGRSTQGPNYFRNLERIALVESLLDHKQLDAARAILNEITDGPPGRKTGLQAALEAAAGNCAAAIPLFDKAVAEGGADCVPSKYREMCAPPPGDR